MNYLEIPDSSVVNQWPLGLARPNQGSTSKAASAMIGNGLQGHQGLNLMGQALEVLGYVG